MNIIKAGYEIMPKFDNPLKKIELVARTCYKSEDLITEDSYINMIDNLVKREHMAMLEHGSVALIVERADYNYLNQIRETMETCCNDSVKTDSEKCYLRFTYAGIITPNDMCTHRYIVSGNIRAWYNFFTFAKNYGYGIQETVFDVVNDSVKNIFDCFKDNVGVSSGCMHFFERKKSSALLITDFSMLTIKERLVHEDISIKFIVDRGVTHELVRMRDCSFAQESTRYCNYSKGKFGNEITVIEPCFFARPEGPIFDEDEWAEKYGAWRHSCEEAERMYFRLLEAGAVPQEARDVLPTSVKADIVMTTNIKEWIHILKLRALGTTGKPHPQMLEVMVPLAKELASGLLSDFTCIDSVNNMLSLSL